VQWKILLAAYPQMISGYDAERIITRAHHGDGYPNVTWRIILPVYLFTTELWHTCSSL